MLCGHFITCLHTCTYGGDGGGGGDDDDERITLTVSRTVMAPKISSIAATLLL